MIKQPSHRQWVLAALEEFECRLVRFAARLLLGDEDAARDVVQHTFLRLCDQSRDEIGGRLAAWLFTVCRNRALDALRIRGREKPLTDETPTNGDGPICRRELEPAEIVQQRELGQIIQRLVRELPAAQREALDLWSEGFTYREIAEIIDKQEGHVRVLVHRGLKSLRGEPRIQGWLHADEPRRGKQTVT